MSLLAERAKDALFSVMRDGREVEVWSDELTANECAALSPEDLARAEADERRWEALHCAAEDAAAERRRQSDVLAFVDDRGPGATAKHAIAPKAKRRDTNALAPTRGVLSFE